jgi:C_GCAxxG_C_C family probable redox protein
MESKAAGRAQELFEAHCNCAQSVFAACANGSELSEAQRLAIAAPFGGGVAREGEVCGAVTGALMVLGERCAKTADDQDTIYKKSQNLIEKFRAEHGSILCRDLTCCILSTEEGHNTFVARNLRHTLCNKLVDSAVKLVEKQ